MKSVLLLGVVSSALLLAACGGTKEATPVAEKKAEKPDYFKPDPATAGTITGVIHFTGKKPARKRIDMSGDPACVEAHKGAAYEDAVVVSGSGALANTFVYIRSGLEGKKFEPAAEPVVIDQRGCGFQPRVLGIQTGQTLRVTNSDPVTHNIHPLAEVNREWNHSQGAGDPPLSRRFVKQEAMIRVKCNIHSWMRGWIGAIDHPYYATSGTDGRFEIRNIPPGNYVLEAWQEALGTQERQITVTPSGKIETDFTFKGE